MQLRPGGERKNVSFKMYLVLHIKCTQEMLPKFHFKGQGEDKEGSSWWVNDFVGENYQGKKKACYFKLFRG